NTRRRHAGVAEHLRGEAVRPLTADRAHQLGCFHPLGAEILLMARDPFVREKEEQLVALDRSSNAAGCLTQELSDTLPLLAVRTTPRLVRVQARCVALED